MEQRKRGATAAERLSPQQHLALSALASGPLAMGQLASETGVAVSTATRMAQGLERMGLVGRVQGEDADRRRRYVALTPLGSEVLAEASALSARRIETLLAVLSPEERRAIVAGMSALTQALADAPGGPQGGPRAPRRPRRSAPGGSS
jgi:DNA-binding MarR family transcriptional regulator